MHHIDPIVLRKAAEQLLTILDAGYDQQLDDELQGELADNREAVLNARWRLTLAGNEAERFAARLSAITDCPLDQARGVTIDLLGYAPKREAGLNLLASLAERVKRLQSQRRRSA